MNRETLKTLSIVSVFAIAMAFLESVIVYYIRIIYYPSGFSFPLIGFMNPEVLKVEIVREIFTLIMLLTVAMLAAKGFYKRFAYFWFAFAIWDIFYYIWLKLILNWPSSLLTWDILFLIPWSWAGPVLAPILGSITMIFLATSILYLIDRGYKFKIRMKEWALLITGGFLQFYTFIYDYGKLIIEGRLAEVGSYIPSHYNWTIFLLGEILILASIESWYKKQSK